MHASQDTNELQVCYVSLPHDTENVFLSALAAQLPEDERIRSTRYRRQEDVLAFAAGRALVRNMLSECAPTPSGGWRFAIDPMGKPTLSPSCAFPDLRFNLSHCSGLVVACVAYGRDVGIDAECLDHAPDVLRIASSLFSTPELAHLNALSHARQHEAFFAFWTLKEAYLKAKGLGLTAAPVPVRFTLEPLTAVFAEAEERSGAWFFWKDQPSPLHMVALAAQRISAEELRCQPRQVPLHDLLC